MRRVVFLLKIFKNQGARVSSLANQPHCLLRCGEGFWRGTEALCQLMGREVMQMLGIRTDRPPSLTASEKTL